MRRVPLLTRLGAGLAGLTLVLGVGACSNGPICGHDRDPRLKTAETDVSEGRLLGLTRSEVESRYGPVSKRTFDSVDMAYYLKAYSMCIDDVWLWITLDPEGRVVDARIGND